MNDLDPKSKEFIKWVEGKFEDQDYILDLYQDVLNQAIDFYNKTPYEALRVEIITKMIAGAREHKEPKKHLAIIRDEIRKEMLDLIGWSLMLRYREEGN